MMYYLFKIINDWKAGIMPFHLSHCPGENKKNKHCQPNKCFNRDGTPRRRITLHISLCHVVIAELVLRFTPKFALKNITYIILNESLLEMIDSYNFASLIYSSSVNFKICQETWTYRIMSLIVMARRWILSVWNSISWKAKETFIYRVWFLVVWAWGVVWV